MHVQFSVFEPTIKFGTPYVFGHIPFPRLQSLAHILFQCSTGVGSLLLWFHVSSAKALKLGFVRLDFCCQYVFFLIRRSSSFVKVKFIQIRIFYLPCTGKESKMPPLVFLKRQIIPRI